MKTIFITGSTDGIGKLAAISLAQNGHKVYVHGRSKQKLVDTVAEIKKNTGNQHIKGFLADLSDFKSIGQLAAEIKAETSQIDILVNNAGVFKSPNTNNSEGLDLRFMVNYLAPYSLTQMLMPLLENGNSPRLINLSSAAQSPVSLPALLGKGELTEQEAYAQSKLALTMWSMHLAKSLDFLNVIAVNPGSLLNTKMANEAYGQFWSPADKGSQIIHDMAVSEEYANSSGSYFDNDKGSFGQAHADAYDVQKIQQLIEATETLLAK